MSDQASYSVLTEQALKRLRALATGNGVEPDSITVLHGEEQAFILEGTLMLTPLCDTERKHHAGGSGRKGITVLQDANELQSEVTKRRDAFQKQPDWIPEVMEELKTAPGEGWGLDQAKITLTKRTEVLAASVPCPQCHGQRFMSCTTCQGRKFAPCVQCRSQRQEFCYNCHGTGMNPLAQGEHCPICRGTRYIVCRMCRGTGQTPCAACGGRGGVACTPCKGSGQITEEVELTFGATAHFELKASGLPSGLRRGLDRLGIANLSKGHADIETYTPKEEKEDVPPPGETTPAKPPQPMVHYRAHLPFADLRMDFGGRKAAVGVFGKKHVLLDVPAFLDEPSLPWREKLAAATHGSGSLNDAIQARALRAALVLELQGKGNAIEFRLLYSPGFSAPVIEEIVRNTHKAVKRVTMMSRMAVAVGCGALSAGLFALCYMTSAFAGLLKGPRILGLAFDLLPLVAAIGVSWTVLNTTARFFLQRKFPDMKIAGKHKAGNVDYAMVVGIAIAWLAILGVSPMHPAWLSFLHR